MSLLAGNPPDLFGQSACGRKRRREREAETMRATSGVGGCSVRPARMGFFAWLCRLLRGKELSASVSCAPGPCPRVKWRRSRAYSQAWLAGVVLVPGIAAVASITLFLSDADIANGNPARAYAFGTAIAVVASGLMPILLRRYAYADRSNPAVYSQLVEIYSAVRLRAECVADASSNGCAAREACTHLVHVGRELGLYDNCTQPSSGLRWVLATGYVDLWRHLHRAEEALMLAEPEDHVIGEAVYDDLRLDGSHIPSADQLRIKLSSAVGVLDAEAKNFLNPPPRGLEQQSAPRSPTDSQRDAARSVLQSIRRTIN